MSDQFGCPICGKPTHVYDSRGEGDKVRRRRRCSNNHRFNTLEKITGQVASRSTVRVEPSTTDAYDELEDELRTERGLIES